MSRETPLRNWWASLVEPVGRIRQRLAASWAEPGHARRAYARLWALGRPESRSRTTAIQIGKSTLAAVVAWYVAARLIGSEAAWLAPATAVLMVHGTVYRSLSEGVKRVVAVAAGAAIAAAIGNLVGLNPLGLLLVVPLSLLGARLRWIRAQGEYVAITAVLLLTFGVSTDEYFLLGYLVATAVGCVTGAATNLLLLPPAYQRSARAAISELATATSEVLGGIADGARSSWSADAAKDWHHRATALDEEVRAAQSALAWSQEGLRWNPWPLRGRADPDLRYRPAIEVLRHVVIEVQGLTRSLRDTMPDPGDMPEREDGEPAMAADELLAAAPALGDGLSPLLAAVAEVVHTFGDDPRVNGGGLAEPVAEELSRAEHFYKEMSRRLPHEGVKVVGAFAAAGAVLEAIGRILRSLRDLDRPQERHGSAEPAIHGGCRA